MKSIDNDSAVAANVWRLKDIFVNVYFIRNPLDNTWILVDTGLKTSFGKIKSFAEQLFGSSSLPKYILLTHGHFDHTGSVKALIDEWEVPVYAHHLEIPFLNGESSYPAPDPTVGGGMMASISFMYPKKPINISEHLRVLNNNVVPEMDDWKFMHTPGHTPGHISLFREKDRVLIAGDACVTTKQESVFSVLLQSKIISGPPKYFTPDWTEAEASVKMLAALEPEILAAGHGKPLSGIKMRKELRNLAENFKSIAIPEHGKYVAG